MPTVEHRIPLHIEVREVDGEQGGRFEFTAEASNNSLDFYYTHMLDSTLRNFARAGQAGVQFLDSHDNRNLGYGRTFGGRVETLAGRTPAWDVPEAGVELAIDPPTELRRALLDIFTIPGIRFGGGLTYASTDDFIRAVRAGLANDVSVGFYGGAYRCDICGGNYRSYQECQHFAGFTYEIGEQGARRVLATVSVDGAELAELSAVYDGATPDAMIIKAERAAELGEIEPATKRLLEARYKVELPERIVSAGVDLAKRGREPACEKEQSMDLEALVNDARAAASEVLDEEMEPGAAIRHLASEVTRLEIEGERLGGEVERLEGEVERLAPLADDGRAYRADLVADALAEGVRAHGEGFSEETYRQILENAPLETVKRMRADWKAVGDRRFPGGRQTVDETEPAGGETRTYEEPDEAYQY